MDGLVMLIVVVGSLAVTLLGVLGLLEKLPPNSFAGIRTPYTRSSPENWYRTHRAAAPLLIWGGVAGTMAGLAFLPFAIAGKLGDGLSSGVVVAIAAVLLICCIAGWLYGEHSAKRATA